jgi:hypothetical protein
VYAASMFLASWPVTTEVVSSPCAITVPCRTAEWMPPMPMAVTAATTSTNAIPRATSELVAALARVRIHPSNPASKS